MRHEAVPTDPRHHGPGVSRRTLLGGLAAAGGLGALGVHLAPGAAAAVVRPSIIGCDTWGAQPATEPIVMTGPPSMIVIHHTASANTTDTSLSAAYTIARSIQSWHFARGWADSGQQFTISRGGYALEGRHRSVEGLGSGSSSVFPLGAHCKGYNSTAIGIENEGTYTSTLPPAAQWSALVDLVAYLCQTYGLSPDAIHGHREYVATSCPGDALYAQLPQLRSDVAAALGTAPPGGRPWPTLQQGSSGFRVTAAQYLLRHSGSSLAVDGAFGPGTKAAVVSFQQVKGLVADGIIGTLTWESPLAVTATQGQTSDAVRAVQTCLVARGYGVAVDGVFGSGTRAAVVSFQQASGLAADGIVGLDTWSRLLA